MLPQKRSSPGDEGGCDWLWAVANVRKRCLQNAGRLFYETGSFFTPSSFLFLSRITVCSDGFEWSRGSWHAVYYVPDTCDGDDDVEGVYDRMTFFLWLRWFYIIPTDWMYVAANCFEFGWRCGLVSITGRMDEGHEGLRTWLVWNNISNTMDSMDSSSGLPSTRNSRIMWPCCRTVDGLDGVGLAPRGWYW